MKRFLSVRKNDGFQKTYKNGASYANRLLAMYIAEGGGDRNRIGISVSKRVGNSVVYRHIARLVREIFRLNDRRLKIRLNVTVAAGVAAETPEYKDLEGAYMHLCRLHHILRESKWNDHGKVFDFVGKEIPEVFISS